MAHARRGSKFVLNSHVTLFVFISFLIGCGGGGASPTPPLPNPQENPAAPTVSLSSDKSTMLAGDTATLTWNSTQATSLTIDKGIGTVPASGSQPVQPTEDTTYTITATGAGGSANAAVTVKISDTRSPVKHVVVIVMQNRSFDHLFGHFPGANPAKEGDPGFVQNDASGSPVSPFKLDQLNSIDLDHSHAAFVNMVDGGKMDRFAQVNGRVAMGFYDSAIPGVDELWGLAQQFALADNFFASVLGDAPTNQLYLVAASDSNRAFGVEPAFGPCNLADPAAEAYTFPNVGDRLSDKNISWTWFAENYGRCGSYEVNQNPFQYFTSTHGTDHIQAFSQFSTRLTSGTLPTVTFIQPTNRNGMHPSSNSDVTVGAQWLTARIRDIQNSTIWADAAIIVIWDSSGGWYDHVPPPAVDGQGLGPRVPMLMISPFSKRSYISHVQMDEVSILKFIQWNWGLSSLNSRNDSPASGDLRDMFAF